MVGYKRLSEEEWASKIQFFKKNYSPCNLCPNRCQAERNKKKRGVCNAGEKVKIASGNLHFGEEPPISGTSGSGTIFFSGCTLKCVYCQNYPISHLFNGKLYSIEELASLFIDLQDRGAHNVNFITPTPYLYHITCALKIASQKGLVIPTVYNSSGYERPDIVQELLHLIDIYLPDIKYYESKIAQTFSSGSYYFEKAYESIKRMFEQTGVLKLNEDGIAYEGVIIRHLILPGHVENSKQVLRSIADSPFKNAYLSLMSQYFPAFLAVKDKLINRRLFLEEYNQVRDYALSLGFENGWFQDLT